MQETLAFVDALVNGKPSPCTGKAGLIALVMAIAAGRSAEEKRWVKFAEMAGELCAMGDSDSCAADVVDSDTGAINFVKLLEPKMGIIPAEATPSSRAAGEGSMRSVPPSPFSGGNEDEATRDAAPSAYERAAAADEDDEDVEACIVYEGAEICGPISSIPWDPAWDAPKDRRQARYGRRRYGKFG